MTTSNFFTWIREMMYGSLETKITKLEEELDNMSDNYDKVEVELNLAKKELDVVSEQYNELVVENQELVEQEPEFIQFLRENHVEVARIAYKNKRAFRDIYYSIYLDELITPDAWEVANFVRKLKSDDNIHLDIKIKGDALAIKLTWKSDLALDKSGDYYLTPSETLIYLLCDCEDHAFCLASTNADEIGVGYGYYYPKGKDNNEKYGHAYNVYLNPEDGKLWIADTVGNVTHQEELSTSNNYETFYIITKYGCFKLKSGVQFGTLANWN